MLTLTRLRLAKHWSRAELARRARMAAGDVGKIEVGRLMPYDSQLRKLARALGLATETASRLLDEVERAEASAPASTRHDP